MLQKEKIKYAKYSGAVIGAIGGFTISRKMNACIVCNVISGVIGAYLGSVIGFEGSKYYFKSTSSGETKSTKEPIIGGLASGVSTTKIV